MKNKELQEILKQYDDDIDIKIYIQGFGIGLVDKVTLTSNVTQVKPYKFSLVILGEDQK